MEKNTWYSEYIKQKTLADAIEEFMAARGEYDYRFDDRIRWLKNDNMYWYTDDRKMTAWHILNDILHGDIKPLIEYLESEIRVMVDDDESILLAEKALKVLKEA